MTSRVSLLVALALGALLLGACRGGGKAETKVDAQQLLNAAATRMDGVGSFHFELTQQNGATPIMAGLEMLSASGDVGGRDRQRLNIKGRFGTIPVQVNVVILPDASYVSNPITGRWEKDTISIASFFDPANGVTALMRSVTDARITGTETLDGVPTHRVEARIDSGKLALFAAGAPAGRALTARAWIGVDEPLVHRLEVEGGITAAEPQNLVRRLDFSRFGQDLIIAPPQ